MKVNIIVQLEFELANYDVAVMQISYYAIGTPQKYIENWKARLYIYIYI